MLQLVGEGEKLLVDIFLVTQVVPLQLDVEPVAEDVFQPRRVPLAEAVLDAVVQKTVGTAREAEQAGGVVLDVFTRGEMLAFFVAELYGRDQFGEVLIAAKVHRNQRKQAAVVHRDLGTDDRLYPVRPRLKMKTHRTRDRVAIKQRRTGHAQIGRTPRQVLRLRTGGEEAESRSCVKFA